METSQLTKTWTIDTAHSKIQFKVKHLVVSTVTGSFESFEGEIESDNDSFEDAQVNFAADTSSITTNNSDRDNHLRSDDFFNAEKFPKINFTSTSFRKIRDDKYRMVGTLVIRNRAKEIELDVRYSGKVKDPYGKVKAAFEVTGHVNRKDFGLKWNAVTEAGGMVVADEVKLAMDVTVVLS